MMKKILALAIAALLVLSVFCGCAAKQAETEAPADTEAPAQTEQTEQHAETEAPAETTGEKQKLTLIIQASDDVRIGIMNDYIVPNFDEAFPGYELEITTITGEDDSIAMMKTYHATGDMADVYWSDAKWSLPIISAGSQQLHRG